MGDTADRLISKIFLENRVLEVPVDHPVQFPITVWGMWKEGKNVEGVFRLNPSLHLVDGYPFIPVLRI